MKSSITSVKITQDPEIRKWLRSRGKHKYIDFDDDERSKLMKYFTSLDQEKKGSIGCKELEEPLIALGLAENRKQVEDMIRSVDSDESGQIEFEEFLVIVKGDKDNAPISKFFKGLIEGKLIKDSKVLPFRSVVSTYRRQMIMNALMCNDSRKKEKGERIMKAFARSISTNKPRKSMIDDYPLSDVKVVFPKYKRIFDESIVRPNN